MLSISIEDIPEEGLELKEKDAASSFGLDDDEFISYVNSVSLSARLEKAGKSVNVKGEVGFKASLTCVRCLEHFPAEIKSALDIAYQPKLGGGAEAHPRDEEADVFYYGEEKTIELGDAVREYIILAIPVKPLCREGCLGLCHSCGKNLNEGHCICVKQKVDSPFAKLKDFKEKGKENIDGCSKKKTI